MTAEEAIYELEKRMVKYHPLDKITEATKHAIEALREKQERDNGHCDYCKDGTRKIPVTQPDGTFIRLKNYCDNCGRPLSAKEDNDV